MRRYRDNSPRWITARFNSTCACGASLNRGDRIQYDPIARTAKCAACGDPESANVKACYPCWDCGDRSGRFRPAGAATPVLCDPCWEAFQAKKGGLVA